MAHGDHYKQSGKPIDAKKTFFRIMTYLAKDKKLLIVIGSLIIISIGCNLVGTMKDYCIYSLFSELYI